MWIDRLSTKRLGTIALISSCLATSVVCAQNGPISTPTANAGGALTGTYPNPGLSSAAVQTALNGIPLNISGLTISGITGLTQCLQVSSTGVVSGSGSACGTGGGGGSGTVNSAAQFSPTYYTVNPTGTTVGGITPLNGVLWYSTTAAPTAVNSTQLQGIIGSGVYDVSGAASGKANTSGQVFTGTVQAPTFIDSGLTTGTAPICPNGTSGAFTTTGCTVGTLGGVNAQTGTSYTVVTGDAGKLVTFSNTSAVAVTLPVASTTGFVNQVFTFKNLNSGIVTVTPTTSAVDGLSTLVLMPYEGAQVWSDGSNYFVGTRNIFFSTAAPTVAANTSTSGAGTGATAVMGPHSTNAAGEIQLTAGSGSSGSNLLLATMTFANGGFKQGVYCNITPASFNAAQSSLFLNGGGSSTVLQLMSTGAVPSGGVFYVNYNCPE